VSQPIPRAAGRGEMGSIILGDQRTRSDLGWVQVPSQSLLLPGAAWMLEMMVHLASVSRG